MKAIQYKAFGHSDVLQLNQTYKPMVQENEVLIKIAATTVNPLEIKIREGYLQQVMPITFPYIPGSDVSGIVEAVGNKVNRIKVGDRVYATNYGGTYAEYISLNEEQAAIIPNLISLTEAAALATPLTTAYTLLVEAGQLHSGQKILIHGASGGVGSIMVQMAKVLGAYVSGTTSGAELDRVKTLGADEIIDYMTQDFTAIVKDVDIVADLVGGETQTKSFEVLKKDGKLISVVMPPSVELAEKYEVTSQFIMSNPSYKKLDYCEPYILEGKIKAQISRIMQLEQAAEAQDLVSKGGVNGKIVLGIN
ncbi:MAG: NADP-dependent oxidoreductase [Arachidicoccus sp.]|nr:NADP-dependent oxidoreductase [Arachidicoccus sp.]